MKPLARVMEETGTSLQQLVEASGLEAKLVKAIATGNYTPSPSERERLATALGVSIDDIAWGTPYRWITSGGTVLSLVALHSPESMSGIYVEIDIQCSMDGESS